MVGLTIRLIGNPEITVGQRQLSFRTRKELAILICLLVEEGMHSRESLMTLLWPDKPAKNATITLPGALSRLRDSLQPAGQFILSQAGKVGFDFEGSFDLDLTWLAAAVLLGALRTYAQCRTILEREFGIQPAVARVLTDPLQNL